MQLKNVTGNVVTGNEKLFLEFEINKKRNGIEKVCLQNVHINNGSLTNILNNDETLLKVEYIVKDTYNNIKGRIGTTLVNFLNEADEIRAILVTGLENIGKFEKKHIANMHKKIEQYISKLKAMHIQTNKIGSIINEIYYLPINKNKIEICDEIISQNLDIDTEDLEIVSVMKKIFLLIKDNSYYKESDLIMIVNAILEEHMNLTEEIYRQILINFVKELEFKIKEKLEKVTTKNRELQTLIFIIFNNFYKDYNMTDIDNRLFDFFQISRSNAKNNINNTYYQEIHKYMVDIQDTKGTTLKKFDKFSIKEMIKIFIKSLIKDIEKIVIDYEQQEVFISNTVVIQKNVYKYEISSLIDLANISRRYILEDGRKLKKCHICGRFFVTETKTTETHCKRIFKDGKTCSEYANYNSRVGMDIAKKISKEIDAIKSMLRKRDRNNDTNQLKVFERKLNNIKKQLFKEYTEEKANEKLFKWLEKEHLELKKRK